MSCMFLFLCGSSRCLSVNDVSEDFPQHPSAELSRKSKSKPKCNKFKYKLVAAALASHCTISGSRSRSRLVKRKSHTQEHCDQQERTTNNYTCIIDCASTSATTTSAGPQNVLSQISLPPPLGSVQVPVSPVEKQQNRGSCRGHDHHDTESVVSGLRMMEHTMLHPDLQYHPLHSLWLSRRRLFDGSVSYDNDDNDDDDDDNMSRLGAMSIASDPTAISNVGLDKDLFQYLLLRQQQQQEGVDIAIGVSNNYDTSSTFTATTIRRTSKRFRRSTRERFALDHEIEFCFSPPSFDHNTPTTTTTESVVNGLHEVAAVSPEAESCFLNATATNSAIANHTTNTTEEGQGAGRDHDQQQDCYYKYSNRNPTQVVEVVACHMIEVQLPGLLLIPEEEEVEEEGGSHCEGEPPSSSCPNMMRLLPHRALPTLDDVFAGKKLLSSSSPLASSSSASSASSSPSLLTLLSTDQRCNSNSDKEESPISGSFEGSRTQVTSPTSPSLPNSSGDLVGQEEVEGEEEGPVGSSKAGAFGEQEQEEAVDRVAGTTIATNTTPGDEGEQELLSWLYGDAENVDDDKQDVMTVLFPQDNDDNDNNDDNDQYDDDLYDDHTLWDLSLDILELEATVADTLQNLLTVVRSQPQNDYSDENEEEDDDNADCWSV